MEFFYSENIKNDIITLDNFESRHCIKVLRKSNGDTINIVDGKGTLYTGLIKNDNPKNCKVKISNSVKEYDKKDFYIHIAISPIKNNNRIEWFIEKVVEIGIDEISFINCERTLRHTLKMDRIMKTAISAMKQTLKATLPKINNITNFEEFIESNKDSNKFICHLEEGHKSQLFHFENKLNDTKDSCILIGPEGDFSIDEINKVKNFNFNSISLGNSRLRTETAGIVACHLLNIIHKND
tara:strand:- start:525 stop:1241 length:717 start_codon:yes stop_codon:yes gene_type:complete